MSTDTDTRQRIARQDAYEYVMALQEPRLTVEQGEEFVLEVENSMSNLIVTEDDLPTCLLYTSPSPRDLSTSRMPSSA